LGEINEDFHCKNPEKREKAPSVSHGIKNQALSLRQKKGPGGRGETNEFRGKGGKRKASLRLWVG